MNRTLYYIVSPQDDGLTIGRFLKKRGFSSQSLIQLKKREDGILKNGLPAYVIHPLRSNDLLTIHIQEDAVSAKIPPVPLPLHIIYEDEDLMILNKPAGMPIHPSMNHYENSLANGLAWYFASRGEPFVFRCINRLDWGYHRTYDHRKAFCQRRHSLYHGRSQTNPAGLSGYCSRDGSAFFWNNRCSLRA